MEDSKLTPSLLLLSQMLPHVQFPQILSHKNRSFYKSICPPWSNKHELDVSSQSICNDVFSLHSSPFAPFPSYACSEHLSPPIPAHIASACRCEFVLCASRALLDGIISPHVITCLHDRRLVAELFCPDTFVRSF